MLPEENKCCQKKVTSLECTLRTKENFFLSSLFLWTAKSFNMYTFCSFTRLVIIRVRKHANLNITIKLWNNFCQVVAMSPIQIKQSKLCSLILLFRSTRNFNMSIFNNLMYYRYCKNKQWRIYIRLLNYIFKFLLR